MTRPRAIGVLIIVVVLGALGFVPVLAGPTYEIALFAGLLCPSVAAVATSRELAVRAPSGAGCFSRALQNGVLFAFVAYAVSFLHGLRAGFCDLSSGTALFLLGPGIGTILGAVWGAVASEIARRLTRAASWRRTLLSVVLALAGPLFSVVEEFVIFYATPMVYAFDPFVGFFSGSLYDTVLQDTGLLSYRSASLATLFAVYAIFGHLVRDERQRLVPSRLLPGLAAIGALAGAASVISIAYGPELGHWQTASSIARTLGGEQKAGRCRVFHDSKIDARRAELLARDCDGHVEAISGWLEVSPDTHVTVYLFADAAQKKRLMGAARTSIAKPWRREIYIQEKGYPHDVLGHELVHALTNVIGRGPFDIAGSVGGLLPNPGLIEGIAVAAAPHDDELTSDEWAAAMRRIDVLPSVSELFSLGFFGEASSTSYTAAGSFVSWVRQRYGIDTVKRWYGGDDIAALTGSSWGDLERAWWQDLDRFELGDAELATARARFDRPGVLERRCPHEVDERMHDAESRQANGDLDGAIDSYRAALSLDPDNVQAHFGVASCYDRLAQANEARAQLENVASSGAQPETIKSGALERIADLALRAGKAPEAQRLYVDAAKGVTSEDRLRTIDIKRHYAGEPLARDALVALLIGTSAHGPDEIEALDRIGEWRAEAKHDGTPDYLLGRQHFTRNDFSLAADRLDAALEKGLPLQRVKNEAIRLRLICACALGQTDKAKSLLKEYRSQPLVSHARARIAEGLVWRASRQLKP